jgi:peptidoglycan/xylan/chitin deacetylase (PgdA/CDA1 family)
MNENTNTNNHAATAHGFADGRPLLSHTRLGLLAWLLVPFLIAWVSVGYLLGILHQTAWDKAGGKNIETVAQSREQVEKFAQDIPAVIWRGQGLVTLWFDDAWESQYTNTLDILSRHNMVGSLAVPTQLIGLEGYMSWAQVKRLQFLGWEITAHSRTHNCNTQEHTEQFALNEVKGSFDDLISHGIFTEHYVLPCGALTNILDKEIKKHYSSNRTVTSGLNELPLQDKYNIKVKQVDPTTPTSNVNSWLEEAKTQGRWLVLMFHQIDNSGAEYSATPEQLREIADTIAQSGVQVVVPSQAINITQKADGN